MSVVAFDGRIVAAETFMGGLHSGQGGMFRKIAAFEKPGKKDSLVVFGITGVAADMFPCIDWWLKGMKDDYPGTDDTDFLVVRPGHKVVLFSHPSGPVHFNAPFACGAGSNHAEAAMAMGANAIEAVEIACRFVNTCQPPVEAFDISSKFWLQSAGDRIATHEGIQEIAKRNKWKAL